ncbi:hypothetical protein ACP70R_049062 [Stipagrostis hirtigluma subsp. patula]
MVSGSRTGAGTPPTAPGIWAGGAGTTPELGGWRGRERSVDGARERGRRRRREHSVDGAGERGQRRRRVTDIAGKEDRRRGRGHRRGSFSHGAGQRRGRGGSRRRGCERFWCGDEPGGAVVHPRREGSSSARWLASGAEAAQRTALIAEVGFKHGCGLPW